MGMTIEEAIYCMQSYLPSEEYTHCTECKYYGCNTNGTCKSNEAHQKAIDTMRKYQKIQEILNSAGYIKNGTVYSYTYDEDSRVKHIREVVENGRI